MTALKIAVLTVTEDGDPVATADTYTLADEATGLVAIARVSDGTVVLASADADAVTVLDVGIYQYDYTDLNLDSGESYYIYFKLVTGGVPTYKRETIQGAPTGKTLRGYSRDILKTGLLGRWGLFTTTSASTSATDTREVISTQIIDKESETSLIESRYEGAFVFIATGAEAGSQRRVTTTNGYIPSQGKLLLNNDFGTVIASGVDFEILRRLPRYYDAVSGLPGIRDIINEALSYCFRVRRLEFTCEEADTYHYDISAYPWITREDQIGPVYDPLTEDNLNPQRHRGEAWLRLNVNEPMLEIAIPFDIGDTFQVDVAQPADTYIKSDGSWGDSTVGLVAEDDEALPEPPIVKAIALGLAFRELSGITDGAESEEWAKKSEAQLAKAALLKGVFKQRLQPSGRGTWNAFTSKGQGANVPGSTSVSSVRRSGRSGIISRRWL